LLRSRQLPPPLPPPPPPPPPAENQASMRKLLQLKYQQRGGCFARQERMEGKSISPSHNQFSGLIQRTKFLMSLAKRL
jgi:hypothetical protein